MSGEVRFCCGPLGGSKLAKICRFATLGRYVGVRILPRATSSDRSAAPTLKRICVNFSILTQIWTGISLADAEVRERAVEVLERAVAPTVTVTAGSAVQAVNMISCAIAIGATARYDTPLHVSATPGASSRHVSHFARDGPFPHFWMHFQMSCDLQLKEGVQHYFISGEGGSSALRLVDELR